MVSNALFFTPSAAVRGLRAEVPLQTIRGFSEVWCIPGSQVLGCTDLALQDDANLLSKIAFQFTLSSNM